MIFIIITAITGGIAIIGGGAAIKSGVLGSNLLARLFLKKRYERKIHKAIANFNYLKFRKYYTLYQNFDNFTNSYTDKILLRYKITNMNVIYDETAFNLHFRSHKITGKDIDEMYTKINVLEELCKKNNININDDKEYIMSSGIRQINRV